jgi:hypothetical protein
MSGSYENGGGWVIAARAACSASGSGMDAGDVAGVWGVGGVGNRLEMEERVESVEESSNSSSAALGRGRNLPTTEQYGYGGCTSVRCSVYFGWLVAVFLDTKFFGEFLFYGLVSVGRVFWYGTSLLSPDGDMRSGGSLSGRLESVGTENGGDEVAVQSQERMVHVYNV